MLKNFQKVNKIKEKAEDELLKQNENKTNNRIFRAWYFRNYSEGISKVIKLINTISVILKLLLISSESKAQSNLYKTNTKPKISIKIWKV